MCIVGLHVFSVELLLSMEQASVEEEETAAPEMWVNKKMLRIYWKG